MRKVKYLLLIAVLTLTLILLTGCGANVSTAMDLDTADGGFSGSRVITLLIDNDDLQYVTGGLSGLETVLQASLPADLTYAVSAPSETQSQITFTLSFTNLEDYKTKVSNLLAADVNNEIVPEITYHKFDTMFRKELTFKENFDSSDLLMWYFNALETANIISESSSNWYEMGGNTLVVDGTELSVYGYDYEYSRKTDYYLDDCDVVTVMNPEGTYDRTITFRAYDSTLEDLAEVSDDFTGYMKALAPEGVAFTSGKSENNSSLTDFTYTMTGLSADAIVANTNAIMQNENNSFSVSIAPQEGTPGIAKVTITEALDISFYMGGSYHNASSQICVFPNFSLTEGDASNYDDKLHYSAYPGETYTFVGEWLVGYEKAELSVSATGKDTLEVIMTFTANTALAEDIREIPFAALEAACGNGGSYREDGNTAVCTFSGTSAETAAALNAFVRAYTDDDNLYQDPEDAPVYCEIELEEMVTASKFTNGILGSMYLNLSPLLEDMPVYVTAAEDSVLLTQLEADEEGALYDDSYVSISFAIKSVNWLTCILTGVFAILLVGGIVMCILSLGEYKKLLLQCKEKAARAKEAKAAAAAAAPVAAPVAAPAAVPDAPQAAAPAPAAEAQPSAAEKEEEEELL